MLEQFKGCMVGGLVGDCLGANFEMRYENLVPKEKIDTFFVNLPDTAKVQRYTDDSAMARQIAISFIDCRGFQYKDLAKRFTTAYFAEPWRGYGGSVVDVFKKLRADGSDPFGPASEQFDGSGSYGNGAGMRAHPIALASFGAETAEIITTAVNVGRITHAPGQGAGGGLLQTLAVSQALTCASPDKILKNLQRDIKLFEAERNNSDYTHKLQLVEECLSKPDEDLAEIGFELGNDVSAIESVPTALFCFLRCCKDFEKTEQFEQTIRLAIRLGGDTDTIASMAGAISGAYLGAEYIPEFMSKPCESRAEAVQLAQNIYNIVQEKNNEGGKLSASSNTEAELAQEPATAEDVELDQETGPPPEKKNKL